jgi:large subunit ribosomal protein L36e
MAPKQPSTGLFVGLNKGHVVTKKELAPKPSSRKGVSKIVNFRVHRLVKNFHGLDFSFCLEF